MFNEIHGEITSYSTECRVFSVISFATTYPLCLQEMNTEVSEACQVAEEAF